ncbi:hypothetical protein D3C81_1313630 [compost metagenome]
MQLGRLHRRLRGLVFGQHAEVIALGGITDQQQIIVSRRQLRIPQMHLVPRHRALAATGQADRTDAQVGAAPAPLGQVTQGNVPATIGLPLATKVQIETHYRFDQQARIDQYEGRTHLLVGELRQVDHAIQHGLELRIEHFLADATLVEEHHGFYHLRLFLQAHRLSSCRPDCPAPGA